MAAALFMLTVVSACSLLAEPDASGATRGGWVWPTAAPLPPGAIAVPLDTMRIPDEIRPNAEYGACPLALLEPVIAEYRPGREPAISYRPSSGAGPEEKIRWPMGFSARLAPRLEIVAPDGVVVAREGEPTQLALGGGFLSNDNTFTVCMSQYAPRRAAAPG